MNLELYNSNLLFPGSSPDLTIISWFVVLSLAALLFYRRFLGASAGQTVGVWLLGCGTAFVLLFLLANSCKQRQRFSLGALFNILILTQCRANQ